MIAWFKLSWLEWKLFFGEFGKYNKYLRVCLERNAKTSAAKLKIAEEVFAGPGVGLAESQWNTIFLRRHGKT